jgi:hypothetical protein
MLESVVKDQYKLFIPYFCDIEGDILFQAVTHNPREALTLSDEHKESWDQK